MLSKKERKNKINNEYYHRNKERLLPKIKEQQKLFYHQNREMLRERTKKSIEKNYERQIYRSCKRRSLHGNLDFDLELTDIVIPEKCPYLQCVLTRTQGQGRLDTNASVDRIDPTKGYTKDNIQIISNQANRMKNNATQEQLFNFASYILSKK